MSTPQEIRRRPAAGRPDPGSRDVDADARFAPSPVSEPPTIAPATDPEERPTVLSAAASPSFDRASEASAAPGGAPAAPSAPPLDPERAELATAHLPLVGHIARELVSRLPSHVDRVDLVSAGSFALVLAARTWDPDRGVPFARYAAIRVRGALTDELRTMDWASRGVRSRARAVADARNSLQVALGHAPTVADVAAATGLSERDVLDSDADLARASVLSLHSPAGEAAAAALPTPRATPEEILVEREALGYLTDAVEELPERLRTVVRGYFFDERPMAELAAELGVTESRISQMRAEAVRMLRAGLAEPLHQTTASETTVIGPRVIAARQAYIAAVASRSSMVGRLRHTSAAGEPQRFAAAE